MKRFRCGDVVPGCTRSFDGTEEAVLASVAHHARADHGVVEMTDEIVTAVRAAMRPI